MKNVSRCLRQQTKSFNLPFNGQVGSYAIRDAEEYKNFCDRPKDQRPPPEEVIGVSHLDKIRFFCFSLLS